MKYLIFLQDGSQASTITRSTSSLVHTCNHNCRKMAPMHCNFFETEFAIDYRSLKVQSLLWQEYKTCSVPATSAIVPCDKAFYLLAITNRQFAYQFRLQFLPKSNPEPNGFQRIAQRNCVLTKHPLTTYSRQIQATYLLLVRM